MSRIDQWLVKGTEGFLSFLVERDDPELKIAINRLYKAVTHLESPGQVPQGDGDLTEYANRMADLLEYRAGHGAISPEALVELSRVSVKLAHMI